MNSLACPTLIIPASFGRIFFVTLRLRDALPASFGQNLRLQYYTHQVKFAPFPDRAARLVQVRKRLFARFDEALDLEKYGQSYLRLPAAAQLVVEEIQRHNGSAYRLLAYSILPNHVHLLFEMPHVPPGAISLDELESYDFQPLRDVIADIRNNTELTLKKILRHSGEHLDPGAFQMRNPKGKMKISGNLWHEQHFDFCVNNAGEYEKIVRYIRQNPAKAAWVKSGETWPFSFHVAEPARTL